MPFDLIPAAELAIDQPDFKAGVWKRTRLHGEAAEYSECYELIEGRWEGFVSVRKIARKTAPRPTKAHPFTRAARATHETPAVRH